MVYCVAPNCVKDSTKNNRMTDGTHFHEFPKPVERERRKLWIRKCKRLECWKPGPSAKLCSDHFIDTDYHMKPDICIQLNIKCHLLKTAVPTMSIAFNARGCWGRLLYIMCRPYWGLWYRIVSSCVPAIARWQRHRSVSVTATVNDRLLSSDI